MEINPFDRKTPETSVNEDEVESTSTSSKKKKKSRSGESMVDKPASAEKPAEADEEKKAESLESVLRRMLGQSPAEENTSETNKDISEEAADESGMAETYEDDPTAIELPEVPLESLAPGEQAEVALAYIQDRQADLVQEQAESTRGEDEAGISERDANLSLLDNVQNFMRREMGGEQSIDRPLAQAYEQTAQWLRSQSAPEGSTSEAPQDAMAASRPVAATVADRARPQRVESAPAATEDSVQEANRTGGALLVGGAIGYFIGRRRERVKSEAQLKTVENKLHAEINKVEQKVVEKETRIRSLAREVYAAEKKSGKAEAASQPAQTEKLGLVTLKAVEQVPTPEAAPAAKKIEAKGPTRRESADALSRTELLEAGEAISVGATNLRRVYETNLITEQGLRRLISEHERGGDVRQSLRRELVEKEASFERDPRLRNRSIVGSLAAGGALQALPGSDNSPAGEPVAKNGDTKTESETKPQSLPARSASSQAPAYVAVATLLVIIVALLYLLFTAK
jgi:hypothetical protein